MRVYLDISIKNKFVGRMTFELFDKDVPKTCENFKSLCTGERGVSSKGYPLNFRGSQFFRVISGFMAQGGDISQNNGKGGESIFEGKDFEDENFIHRHSKRGMLSMANQGPNTNGSQFFISFKKLPQLDKKHVVFGEIVEGMNVLDLIEKVAGNQHNKGKPAEEIKVISCGVL